LPRNEIFRLTAAYIESLHDDGIAFYWPGIEPVQAYDCINPNLLESAAEQPFQAGFGVEFYPTIYDKAACLFFSIAGGHIFSNGNKRASVLALDQFLSANSIYLYLSNRQIKNDAEKTASYRIRGEDHKMVMARLSRRFKSNSIPFSVMRAFDRKMYRELLEVRRVIRNNELNRPGTRPKQAVEAG
jgi:prophage maintenance system killer protein